MKLRLSKLVLSLGLGLAALFAALSLLTVGVSAADHCVDTGGAGGCFTTIQAAVNAAGNGDTVQVTAGTYHENVVVNKSLILLGGFDDTTFSGRTPRSSAVDGGGNGRVFSIAQGAAVTIDGFTISGGDATNDGGNGGGVAVREATAVLNDNLIEKNVGSSDQAVSGSGGGVYVISSTLPVSITQNTIQFNIAQSVILSGTVDFLLGSGGGIRISKASAADIIHNQILSNVASDADTPVRAYANGGGISGGGSDIYMTIKGNIISGNIARKVGTIGSGYGGGISLFAMAEATVSDNELQQNVAAASSGNGFGGGMEAGELEKLTISNNHIERNIASEAGVNVSGGGLRLLDIRDLQVTGNRVISNTAVVNAAGENMFAGGGGIEIRGSGVEDESAVVEGNYIVGNTAVQTMSDTVDGSVSYASGGGLAANEIATIVLTNNTINNKTSRSTI